MFEIWRHVATHNSEVIADRVFDSIERACGRLKDYPRLGRARPEIHADSRSLVIDRWLAIYRVTESGAHCRRSARPFDNRMDIVMSDFERKAARRRPRTYGTTRTAPRAALVANAA